MDPLDVLGDSELRATLLHVRGRGGAPTAADVAAALDVPLTVARWRLERLAEAGLLIPAFERRMGRTGRPPKTYEVAPETSAIEFPGRNHVELIRLLIDALPASRRTERLDEVGAAFGGALATKAGLRSTPRLATAVERVCRAVGSLGFHASVESVSSDEAVLVSATCPLRPLVVDEPAARRIDQAMWGELVRKALRGDAQVTCATHGCLDAGNCRVVISLSGNSQR